MFRRRGRWAMRRGQRRTWAHDSAGAPRPTSKVVFDTVPVKWNEYERQTQSAPSPLVGEGWGGGWCVWQCQCADLATPTPTPTPPPQGGGERTECAVLLSIKRERNVR